MLHIICRRRKGSYKLSKLKKQSRLVFNRPIATLGSPKIVWVRRPKFYARSVRQFHFVGPVRPGYQKTRWAGPRHSRLGFPIISGPWIPVLDQSSLLFSSSMLLMKGTRHQAPPNSVRTCSTIFKGTTDSRKSSALGQNPKTRQI